MNTISFSFHGLFFSYDGPLMEEGGLKSCIKKGLDSDVFIELVTSVCSELKQLCSLQEAVSKPQGSADSESFELEMRSFLKELNCPHTLLGELGLLGTYRKKLLLVDFVLSELLAARLAAVRRKNKGGVEDMEVDGDKGAVHSVPANLEAILRAYDIKKPPPNITVKQVFDRIIGKVSYSILFPRVHAQ